MKRRDVFSRILGFLGIAGVAAAENPKSGHATILMIPQDPGFRLSAKFVTEADLQYLPPDLYVLPGYRENQIQFIATTNQWCISDQYWVARIRETFDAGIHECYGIDSEMRPDGAQVIKSWCALHGMKFFAETREECLKYLGFSFDRHPTLEDFSQAFTMTVLETISGYERHVRKLEYTQEELKDANDFIAGWSQWPPEVLARRNRDGRATLTINKMMMIEHVAVCNSHLAGENLTDSDRDKFSIVIYRQFSDSQRLLNYFHSAQAEEWGLRGNTGYLHI